MINCWRSFIGQGLVLQEARGGVGVRWWEKGDGGDGGRTGRERVEPNAA